MHLYRVTGGKFKDYFGDAEVIAGIEKDQTGITRQEIESAIEYLEGRRLIRYSANRQVRFEQAGVDEIEAKVAHPERPTTEFPTVINIAYIDKMYGSQFQQGTTNSDQTIHVPTAPTENRNRSTAGGVNRPKTLRKMVAVLGWRLNDDEAAISLSDMLPTFERLEKLTSQSRSFLCGVLERSEPRDMHSNRSEALAVEIEAHLGMNRRQIAEQVAVLEKYNLAFMDADEGTVKIIVASPAPWNVLDALKSFCTAASLPIHSVIGKPDFTLLD